MAVPAHLRLFLACALTVHCGGRALQRPTVTSADLPLLPPPHEEGSAEAKRTTPGSAAPSADAPAHRYGAMEATGCLAELGARHIAFTPVDSARGVRIPVRLAGPIHGVTFRSLLPEKQRATSPYEIFDCRLVLALSDMARELGPAGVQTVIHYSAYRPPGRSEALDEGGGKRHGGALAIDIASFVLTEGTTFNVERDFDGALGEPVCGEGVRKPSTHATFVLHDIACRAYGRGLFHVMLTPNHDRAHKNHFHFEVAEKTRWFYLR